MEFANALLGHRVEVLGDYSGHELLYALLVFIIIIFLGYFYSPNLYVPESTRQYEWFFLDKIMIDGPQILTVFSVATIGVKSLLFEYLHKLVLNRITDIGERHIFKFSRTQIFIKHFYFFVFCYLEVDYSDTHSHANACFT